MKVNVLSTEKGSNIFEWCKFSLTYLVQNKATKIYLKFIVQRMSKIYIYFPFLAIFSYLPFREVEGAIANPHMFGVYPFPVIVSRLSYEAKILPSGKFKEKL